MTMDIRKNTLHSCCKIRSYSETDISLTCYQLTDHPVTSYITNYVTTCCQFALYPLFTAGNTSASTVYHFCFYFTIFSLCIFFPFS